MPNGATTSSTQSNPTLANGKFTINPTNQAFGDSKQPNALHQYASFNYLISLSCISPSECKGFRYRKSLQGPFLVNSGSRTTNWVETAFGKFEFFIENLNINHVISFDNSLGNTNAASFTFNIIEPYSMGLFYQAWKIAANEKGYTNYLEAIFVLSIEFTGHIDPDNQNVPLDEYKRYYPIRIRIANMQVTTQGCVYDIQAIPVNEQSFEKSVHIVNTSVSIVGKTVKEILKEHPEKSLEVYLNKRMGELSSDKVVAVQDRYKIIFKDEATNPIALSDMGFDEYRSGDIPFAKDNLVFENGVYKRGNIEINHKDSEFRFSVGSDITNIINQVIFMSTYGRNALTKIDELGYITWWRVEVEIEYDESDANLPSQGTKPKTYIFRIVPYEVDSSYFLPPNDKRKGTKSDIAEVIKQYNYLYSGKNLDIIDFNINFSAGFYSETSPDANKNEGDKNQTRNRSASYNPKAKELERKEVQYSVGTPTITNAELPSQQKLSLLSPNITNQGGGGLDDPKSLAARQFHNAITQVTDMVTLEMTILGDPYYLSDSGMGSYHASRKSKYLNVDNAMPWDVSEVHILLNFATPVDIDLASGLYAFDRVYKCGIFSGLYKVNLVTSTFNKGKFTQKLSLMRLRNQDAPAGDGQLSVPPEELLNPYPPDFDYSDFSF